LVDGERDVEEVLFQSPEGQMTAAHHLADALARGLVRPSQVQGNSLLERSAADFLRLPVAPHVPGMLFSIFNADAHVIRRTAEVMAEDPVLTARALKGLSLNNTEVPRNKLALQSIAELLGGPQLRSILIPEAVRGLFFSRPHSFWREGWEHSVACARWSRWLAGLIEYPFPEEAYLAGLLHNFGAFLLVNHNHQLYTRIIQESYERKVDIQALEESAFGTCHTRLGSQLAEKWGFPKALSTVIEAHHGR
jgi:HD-like signal output (HDOD) protein